MLSFRHAVFVVIVENNYGGSVFANNHAAEVKMENVSNVQFARRNKSGKPDVDPGVYTTSITKPKMLEKLRKFINLRGIRFSEYIISVCDPSRDATAMTHFFVDQLLGFRKKIEEDPNHPENPSKVTLSGKIGPMKRDDLVDVAAMNLFWHNQISL
jgi:hypothetical protein